MIRGNTPRMDAETSFDAGPQHEKVPTKCVQSQKIMPLAVPQYKNSFQYDFPLTQILLILQMFLYLYTHPYTNLHTRHIHKLTHKTHTHTYKNSSIHTCIHPYKLIRYACTHHVFKVTICTLEALLMCQMFCSPPRTCLDPLLSFTTSFFFFHLFFLSFFSFFLSFLSFFLSFFL